MSERGRAIEFILVPGLEEKIRRLAEDQFGESSKTDTTEQLIALLLPDLIENALAGDMVQVPDPEGEPTEEVFHSARDQEDELPSEVRAALDAAVKAQENPNVEVPLEVREDAMPPLTEPPGLPSFEEFSKDKRIHPDAVTWAKGSPARENALIETCLGMPPGMWGISKMPQLVERTYNLRYLSTDDTQ